jgi:hypothetical protein
MILMYVVKLLVLFISILRGGKVPAEQFFHRHRFVKSLVKHSVVDLHHHNERDKTNEILALHSSIAVDTKSVEVNPTHDLDSIRVSSRHGQAHTTGHSARATS